MDKTDDDWRIAVKLLALFLLSAALIYFGAQTIVLSHDLKKAHCAGAYWKAVAQGRATNYCPLGCECDPWMLW
jgi:hypothetical protein